MFHTRQQHTLKVAQVGRRLAQRCRRQLGSGGDGHLDLDENVVEAACLAHDLGHPPFGHVGEHVLNELVTRADDADGYEGNAQSFRIVTKLAVRFAKPGLDLTRATLSACLKYPWLRNLNDPDRSKKWGAYRCDSEDFEFARFNITGEDRTIEAEIMDWADDIAYSVHDLEDFHRCRLIPWRRIFLGSGKDKIVANALSRWHSPPEGTEKALIAARDFLADYLLPVEASILDEPYEGSREQREGLRATTSSLIGKYIDSFRLIQSANGINPDIESDSIHQIKILKQITWDYVISDPSLKAQQAGQEAVIRFLFKKILRESKTNYPAFLPTRLRYLWDLRGQSVPRFVSDCVSALTEAEATGLYARLTGWTGGSVLDPIVR